MVLPINHIAAARPFLLHSSTVHASFVLVHAWTFPYLSCLAFYEATVPLQDLFPGSLALPWQLYFCVSCLFHHAKQEVVLADYWRVRHQQR